MTSGELRAIPNDALGRFLERHGQVLYSGIETLDRGKFYFIGFNPAVDDSNVQLSDIRLDMRQWSAYEDQCWFCGDWTGCCRPGCGRAGNDYRQVRVRCIMNQLGKQPSSPWCNPDILIL